MTRMTTYKLCPVLAIIHVCILNPSFLFAVNAVLATEGFMMLTLRKRQETNKSNAPSNPNIHTVQWHG